ncbi:MAG: hypothetical protein ACTSUF_07635 [Candidatus Heimdallarchaeaceae archaeon]
MTNRNINHTRRIAIVIGLLCLSMLLVQPFSIAVPNVLAVQLDHSESVNKSITTLKSNIPNVVVVKYNSFDYYKLFGRTIGPVIWISHGSKDGVLINGNLKSWSVLAHSIQKTPNKDIVLACHSGYLITETDLSDSDVLTFNYQIDATIGALAVSYILTQKQSLFNEIIHKALSIQQNPEEYMPLDLGPHEMSYWILMFVIVTLSIIVGFSMPKEWSLPQKLALQLYVTGKLGIITTLCWYAAGWLSLSTLITKIASFIWNILGLTLSLISGLPWWEMVIYGTALAINIGIIIAGGSAPLWLKIAGVIASYAVLAAGIFVDWQDSDDIVG